MVVRLTILFTREIKPLSVKVRIQSLCSNFYQWYRLPAAAFSVSMSGRAVNPIHRAAAVRGCGTYRINFSSSALKFAGSTDLHISCCLLRAAAFFGAGGLLFQAACGRKHGVANVLISVLLLVFVQPARRCQNGLYAGQM